jgi:hypothetical protein
MIALPGVAIVGFAAALMIQTQPQSATPQTNDPPLDESWTISGRVTDRETGQPLPRARVGVYSGDIRRAPLRATITDARGYYELANLTAGSYMVMAQPPPYVATHLPQVHGIDSPFDPLSVVYISAEVLKGQHLRDVDISLLRSGTIEGRVVNGDGYPLAGIAVAINRSDRSAGEPIVRLTDDHGVFRHFGLHPGKYRVCASAPAGAAGTGATLRRACYTDGKEPIDVGAFAVSGLEIRMGPGRAATVSGILVDSTGAPLEQNHLEVTEQDGVDRKPLPIEHLPGGRFVVRNVEPGSYRFRAWRRAESPLEKVAPELATLTVRIDGDVEDLVVRTRAAAGVSGTVVFEDGVPSSGIGKMMVHARNDEIFQAPAFSGSMPMMFQNTGMVRDDSSFQIATVLGQVRIAVSGQPTGWLVKSITYRGRDITDSPVEFDSSGPNALTVVLTNRVASVTGRVVASVVRKRAVLLVASDRNRWTNRSAIVATAGVKDDGTFTMPPVLAGDYYIVATSQMNWMVESSQGLVSAIERLTTRSTMLTLAEGERRQLTVYVSDER